MKDTVVIDYGAGNLASVCAALKYVKCSARVVTHARDMSNCDCIILPGVGDGAFMMKSLHEREFVTLLRSYADADTPIFGICVGAQVLLSFTKEGNVPCLDIIDGVCEPFSEVIAREGKYKIPHMGWNEIILSTEHETHPLFHTIASRTPFYFVNSYYLNPHNTSHSLASTQYGISFASIIGCGKTVGTQFHPEKSGEQGLTLLYNFLHFVAEVL